MSPDRLNARIVNLHERVERLREKPMPGVASQLLEIAEEELEEASRAHSVGMSSDAGDHMVRVVACVRGATAVMDQAAAEAEGGDSDGE